ncbi:3-ketoacyl-CoA thiolase, mitochondrial-like [Sinocyclocheilus rhinocerous]|uniref:3-ketoacyl-CoA thiolase, mitochondrial-like n=1 Tax=Sinocyclocheilus rhinocerous TaxID=307959 RepID=UPI0007B79557|nr:PREDICTED: 3-ketoacyl-CoA thiolase, mitochondrial-like [Sinocyclocheilus rhinocerous]
MSLLRGVFIVSAKRTPFGTYGGVLKDHSATDLAEHAAKAALVAGNVAPELVNSVIVGNVMQDCYGEAGHYNAEIAPIDVKAKKGKVSMTSDEHPRPQTTLEQMAKLPSVFKKGGTVTAANASGVSDGAAAVVLASEDALKAHKLTPLARIVAYHTSGCDPSIMGIGPVPAITEALKKAGLSLEDMDLVEVNEAFASQYLAVAKALGLDPAKTNVNGGAIAIGHPLGASGTRITAHLVHELRRRGGKYAVGSACIGGGQGIAIVLENTN